MVLRNPSWKSPALLLLLCLQINAANAESSYPDVEEFSSSSEGIEYMTAQGWVSGYDDGTFKPNESVNRVEALKMILEATERSEADLPITHVVTEITPFPDLPENAWYKSYVNLGYALGIINGNEDGTLRPEAAVNRAEALKMLLLAAKKESELTTTETDEWFSSYLNYAKEKALLTPNAEGDFLPASALTRGELCDLIYRFAKAPFQPNPEFGIASYYGRSFDGHNTASGTPLDTEGFMAAHKTLPFGSKVRITNLSNNHYVDVTIVDRGPYTAGYIIDLTPTAFEQIGKLSTGILKVRLEVLN